MTATTSEPNAYLCRSELHSLAVANSVSTEYPDRVLVPAPTFVECDRLVDCHHPYTLDFDGGHPPVPRVQPEPDEFRLVDGVWNVRFRGVLEVFKDYEGFGAYAVLLANPDKEFAVAGLWIETNPPPPDLPTAGQHAEPEDISSGCDSRQPVFDAYAIRAFRDEFRQYELAIERAQRSKNPTLVAVLQNERDDYVRWFKKEIGCGGKSRDLFSAADALRGRVNKAMRRVRERLEKVPATAPLAEILARHVETSPSYVYRPPVGHPGWRV